MIAGAPDLQQQCIYREVNQHIHRLAASYQNNDIIRFNILQSVLIDIATSYKTSYKTV